MLRILLVLKALVIPICIGLLASATSAQMPSLVPPVYLSSKYLAAPDAPSSIVVAGADEPGERLVVTGRVMYGTKLISGASVYVFHTDAKGRYALADNGLDAELNPRLHGALRTDSAGRYQYATTRPGSYDNNAAHVHYIVVAPGYRPRIFDLWFEDDPILVARRQAGEPLIPQSMRNSPFYKAASDLIAIRPVIRDSSGTFHVVRDLDMFPE
jgi:protocatechuate 3,4-dioxygenase beta subunit